MTSLLGVQSHFSFHWGTASPAALFARAAALGYTHLGIADHAGLHGLPEIVRLAETSPVRPIYGAAFPFLDGNGVLAYAASADGYANLCLAITRWLASGKTASSGARAAGVEARAPAEFAAAFGLEAGADERRIDGLAFIVDDLSAWRALRAVENREAEVHWRIRTLAAPPAEVRAAGASAVFAPEACFLRADDFVTHRLLRAIGGGLALDRIPRADRPRLKTDADALMAAPTAILRAPDEYADRFEVFADAIAAADRLAERLAAFTPGRDLLPPPSPDDPPAGDAPISPTALARENSIGRLRRLAYEGAAIRYGEVNDAVAARLEHELGLIGRKRFAEYFLVVHDIVARLAGGDAREHSLRGRSITCGRGSGAASLVNYCLGVTNVDALKHNLMFERFLNDARADPPDIDVDFAWDERDEVLERVFERFGDERVARVANHNKYDVRGALRAAARAMGFPDPDITRRMKEMPQTREGYDQRPDLRRVDAAAGGWDEAVRLSRRLVGIPHGVSMHCGGVVLSPDAIARHVPTARSAKGQPTIQWEKDGTEDMGLVKIDLLGNRSLAVIRDAVRAIARDTGLPEHQIIPDDPSDDEATRELMRRGDTFGVFYMESPAMRLLLAKAKRGDFEHAVIHSSIIRPAAVKFITEYLERLHGKPWEPEHPSLAGVFDETYGIPVYQEDVVKLAMALAGYDYTSADKIRKALGKHDAHARIDAAWPALADACRARGVDEKTLHGFREILLSMTGYSFCKPHSASYAKVSYESAFLRAHYPAHFIAAVLSNGGGFYSVQSYVSEAMRMGLRVLGPDVNRSDVAWRAEGTGAIRTGLSAISGLTKRAMETIPAARGKGYHSLEDFQARTRLHADDGRRLALVGALDALAPGLNRPQILWCMGQLTTTATSGVARPAAASPASRGTTPTRRPGARRALSAPVAEDGGLFAALDGPRGGAVAFDGKTGVLSPAITPGRKVEAMPALPAPRPPRLPAYTVPQRQEAEYAALGFLPGGHPLSLYEERIREGMALRRRRRAPAFIAAARMGDYVGDLVTMLAWPVTAKIVETKHGEAMIFQSFEDYDALVEAVLFPKEFQRFHRLLSVAQPLWVTGRVESEFNVPILHALSVEALCSMPPGFVNLPVNNELSTVLNCGIKGNASRPGTPAPAPVTPGSNSPAYRGDCHDAGIAATP